MLIFVYKIVLFQIKFDKNSNQNFKIAENWLQNHPNFEWVKPDAGAVAFIPIKKPIHTQSFYETDLRPTKLCLAALNIGLSNPTNSPPRFRISHCGGIG